MDMKVNATMAPVPVETTTQVNHSDGTFKFTLASHIQEADLQARLNTLMEEITMQGKKYVQSSNQKKEENKIPTIQFVNNVKNQIKVANNTMLKNDTATMVAISLLLKFISISFTNL